MAWGHAAASAVTRTGAGGSHEVMRGFVPEVWTGPLLKAYDDKAIALQLVNREYEGAIKQKGDTVRVHMVGNIIAREYEIPGGRADGSTGLNARESIIYQTATGASTTFAVDQADYFAFEVEDIEKAQSDPKYVAELTARSGVAMAQATDRYILKKMIDAAKNGTADDFGQVGGTSAESNDVYSIDTVHSNGANEVYDHLVDLGVMFDDALAPDDGRWIVAPSFLLGALLKDERFVGAGADGSGKMRDQGYVGSVAGFKIYTMARKTFQYYDAGNQNTQVPADTATALTANAPNMWTNQSSADDLYTGIAGVNSAFTFADQITKTENVRLEGSFADGVRGLHVYGGKALRPQHLFAVQFVDTVDTAGVATP